MEYMEEHLDEWLGQELEVGCVLCAAAARRRDAHAATGCARFLPLLSSPVQSFGEDDYLLFDCPGQIELYSHVNVFRSFVDFLRKDGWQVCAVYCMDAQFVAEAPKFIGGCLSALSAMVHLELPHINVLTKADLIQNKEVLDDYLFPSVEDMQHRLDTTTAPHLRPLNAAMAQLVDQFGLVSFVSLDITDEESIEQLLLQVDSTIQVRRRGAWSSAQHATLRLRRLQPLPAPPAVRRGPGGADQRVRRLSGRGERGGSRRAGARFLAPSRDKVHFIHRVRLVLQAAWHAPILATPGRRGAGALPHVGSARTQARTRDPWESRRPRPARRAPLPPSNRTPASA